MKNGKQNKPRLPKSGAPALPAAPASPEQVDPLKDKEKVRREKRYREIAQAEGIDKSKRLMGLFEKWANPKKFTLKTSEEEELLSYKIILPMASLATPAEAPENDVCYSQDSLAAKMTRHYQNPDGTNKLKISIDRKVISQWNQGHALGHNQVEPPGPIAGTKTRYSLKAWIDWFDKNLLSERLRVAPAVVVAPAAPAEDDEEDFIAMEQREKRDAIKHRRWERDKERGEYVHREIALATGIAAVKRLHLMVKQEDERSLIKLRREKLLELGIAADVVETFSAWDKDQMRQATDRRELEMESAGKQITLQPSN